MKNVCIIFLLSIIISLTALGFSGVWSGENGKWGDMGRVENAQTAQNIQSEYLRIHIRADSNESKAQAVKYAVRDKIVEYLTPIVAECETKAEATQRVRACLGELSKVASRTLQEKGFSYGATAELTVETFPTRVYDACTLPAGEYAALIVRLGSGEGDNWWCVVYPPLCFAAPMGQNVIYKSKIKEIIQRFYAER